MKKRSLLAVAAAAALFAIPVPANADGHVCGGASGPASGGEEVATPAGTVYYAGSADGGFIGEKSDRGYIQADGDADGINIHGTTTDGMVNGAGSIGTDGSVSICLLGETVV